jgi:branched-chain amino acid transport system substrate-binding protein
LANRPNAKIAVLSLNDDYGRDYVKGFKDGLGERASTMIVREQTYDITDPTVDSQIVTLKASGADTFFAAVGGRQASQAYRKSSTSNGGHKLTSPCPEPRRRASSSQRG